MNRYIKTIIAGLILTSVGIVWEIGTTLPDFFKNIVIDIVFPPTYRILEVVGLFVFVVGVWYNIKCAKEKMEQE